MSIQRFCPQCNAAFTAKTGKANRADNIGAPLYCGRACAGFARRGPPKTVEQKKAENAAYDRGYRQRDPEAMKVYKALYYQEFRDREKDRAARQARMPQHVDYCRRPEYRAKKHEYDIARASAEYADFSEAWRLLLDLEKEIRSQATAYERRVANGYYTRNAQKRRRELWQLRKTQNSTPAILNRSCGRR